MTVRMMVDHSFEPCAETCNTTTPWLIVFDNIGTDFDLTKCIPRGAQNGCVLCTSRVMLDRNRGKALYTHGMFQSFRIERVLETRNRIFESQGI